MRSEFIKYYKFDPHLYFLYSTAHIASKKLYQDDDDYKDGVISCRNWVDLAVVSRFTVYTYVPNYFSLPVASSFLFKPVLPTVYRTVSEPTI